jgi:sulfhydrogenase subunit beta (sulfur reductase)
MGKAIGASTERKAVVLGRDDLETILLALVAAGYRTIGPQPSDDAVVWGGLPDVDALPRGCHDQQAPGSYHLVRGEDEALFAWAVGPHSLKAQVFPSSATVWTSDGRGEPPENRPVAVFGARPCELAALDVLDAVLGRSAGRDPLFVRRRQAMFVVVVECGSPSGTCFCESMGTGPQADGGFDLALTEVLDDLGHRFVARAGSARGEEVLAAASSVPAAEEDLAARRDVLQGASRRMGRKLETEGLRELLAASLDSPRWEQVAERCLACGNCTLVCPTCFCSNVEDVTDLTGTVERRRTWSSCFDLGHSYVHGGPVRESVRSRYRQWMTHKLSTWWDQFGTSGCVGCGRCITWCPVGIDITEEAAALRAASGREGS